MSYVMTKRKFLATHSFQSTKVVYEKLDPTMMYGEERTGRAIEARTSRTLPANDGEIGHENVV